MEKDELFDVRNNIVEANDVYDYSDLEDLSLIEPKKKDRTKEAQEDDVDVLEEKATQGLKVLGIFTLVLAVCVVLAVGIFYLTSNMKKNTYAYCYKQGVDFYEHAKYSDAIEWFEKSLTYKEANKINERLFLYKCYKETGNEEKAISVLLDLLEEDQKNVEAISVVAAYYQKTGNSEKLESFISRYIGTELESVVASYMLKPAYADVESGDYSTTIRVSLSTESGECIYYTLDGTTPTVFSDLYTEPIVIGQGVTTLNTVVISANGINSEVKSYTYNIVFTVPDAPNVVPASGSYTENQKIVIDNITEGITAYYTLDGTDPTTESEQYLEPIDMPGGNIIFSVVFVSSDQVPSIIVKRNYNLKLSDKYTFDDSVKKIRDLLVKKKELSNDGETTTEGAPIKFVYYAKREVDGKEMYLMYLDIMMEGTFVRQNSLFGVDVQKGTTYIVDLIDGKLTSKEYK